MIASSLADLYRYKGLNANLDKALAWLASGGWEDLPVGRKDIEGDRLYVLIQAYETKMPDAARYESHRDYLDIQLLIAGREIIEVVNRDSLKVAVPYKPDIEFYETPEPNPCYSMSIGPGDALIFFPEDAHRPCLTSGALPTPVRKLVLKIRI
jgi:biofilm protein TabA